MERRRSARRFTGTAPRTRRLGILRRLISGGVAVAALAFGLALGGPPPEVAAQTVGDLPTWVTLSGSFSRADDTSFGDSVWNYYFPSDDWSAHIEWGLVDGGNRGTSGDRVNADRRLCHGPRDVDLNAVQFELTWRNRSASGFVSCEDLAALFGAGLAVDLEPGGARAFNCDLLYSYFSRSGGAYVDCLTTDMAARPSLLPQSLTLVSVEQTEDFSIDVLTSVPPSSVKSGSTVAFAIRVTDGTGQPFVGRRMGVEVIAGPTYDAGLSSTAMCYRDCVINSRGTIHVSYETASLTGESRREVIDLLRVYLDKTGNGRYDIGEDPFRTQGLHILRPVKYVALGDSYSSGEVGRNIGDEFDGKRLPGTYLTTDETGHPSDPECRRWSQSYSQVLNGAPFGAGLTVSTYACTGAITDNIVRRDSMVEDPDDPTSKDYKTNRPSVSGDVPTKYEGSSVGERKINRNWEPRQSVSLKAEDEERSVDMITVTIGGNDINFASVMTDCVEGSCDIGSLNGTESFRGMLVDIEERLVAVYTSLKNATVDGSGSDHEATVFVFGYPHLVPPGKLNVGFCRQLTAGPALDWGEYIYHPLRLIAAWEALGSGQHSDFFEITPAERDFIVMAANSLDATIERATQRAGVHYISVAEAFNGHYQCSGSDWIYGIEAAPGAAAPSDRSFHLTEAGHAAYAGLLSRFIRTAAREVALDPGRSPDTDLTSAGLPFNPPPLAVPSQQQPMGAHGDGSISAPQSSEQSVSTGTGILFARPSSASSSACPMFAPGDRVTLSADGFADGVSVDLAAKGVTAAGTSLVVPTLSAVTANGDGSIEASWTVPAAPAPDVDTLPRWYLLEATGVAASGGTLTALTPRPIVAYPGSPPCASDDTAVTTVGRAVRVAVLANDVAPHGGSLDATSVRVESVYNGTVAVNPTDGSLTYTPAPGFVGTETLRYWVYDTWGVGVPAELTVTVNAGCTITGKPGAVVIEGTSGDDVICVPDMSDRHAFHVIRAKAGDDVIIGGDGIDWIDGGPGRDTIYARRGDDRIDGGSGVDTIHGGLGFDTIHSADLADTVRDAAADASDGYEFIVEPPPTAGIDPVLYTDEVWVGAGNAVAIGVLDNDYDPNEDIEPSTLTITQSPTLGTAEIRTSAELGAHVHYTAGAVAGADALTYRVCDRRGGCTTAAVSITVGKGRCTIVGTAGDDILRGTPGPDVICGLAGDDTIYGLDGSDVIVGGAGNDTVHGGGGNDRLWGGPGGDKLYGDAGGDTLHGGSGSDTLSGGSESDLLWGGPGGDKLYGDAGSDTLFGGLGDDTLRSGSGTDSLWGGPGDDDLVGNHVLRGGPGDDMLRGGTRGDVLWGGPGDDTLYGGGGRDRLYGGTGDDTLHGEEGGDWIFGEWGADTLLGGGGVDYLGGGDGSDGCSGGEVVSRCET